MVWRYGIKGECGVWRGGRGGEREREEHLAMTSYWSTACVLLSRARGRVGEVSGKFGDGEREREIEKGNKDGMGKSEYE